MPSSVICGENATPYLKKTLRSQIFGLSAIAFGDGGSAGIKASPYHRFCGKAASEKGILTAKKRKKRKKGIWDHSPAVALV